MRRKFYNLEKNDDLISFLELVKLLAVEHLENEMFTGNYKPFNTMTASKIICKISNKFDVRVNYCIGHKRLIRCTYSMVFFNEQFNRR